jgi:anti-sigma factor ChrR (cupin superfamily)
MAKGLNIKNIFSSENRISKSYIPTQEPAELIFKDYQVEGRTGVSVFMLYDESNNTLPGPAAAFVRYQAGAITPTHLHPGWELVLVLEGELIDDDGRYLAGELQIFPPHSVHALRSESGCSFLVVWEQPVRPVKSAI